MLLSHTLHCPAITHFTPSATFFVQLLIVLNCCVINCPDGFFCHPQVTAPLQRVPLPGKPVS